MNRSTLRKIRGDLWTRKGRTALVSISIFIGVLGVVTLITAGDLLVSQLKEDIKADELPMLDVFIAVPPSEEGAELNTEAYIDGLQENFPSITEIEGEANTPFYWKFSDEDRFREARLFSFTTPMSEKLLEPMRLVEGAYPEAGQQEIAVEQRMADDFDLAVGDSIDLRMLGLEELPTETWTISGIVFHAYNQASSQSMFMPLANAAAVSGIEGVNTLAMRFTDFETAREKRAEIMDYINAQTPYAAQLAMPSDPSENQAIETTEQFNAILSALAIVAMLVSGFLVLNVINNLVVEQRRQIGVMKSLGATRRETFVIYGGIAVSYGLLGMIPGVLGGIPLGYQMAVIVGDFANTLIDSFAVSPLAIGLGILLGLAVPIISAIVPVWAGTRVTILEAMTDLGIGGNYSVGIVSRIVKALPLPLNIKQSLNNLTQKKARLALTVITLTLATTAFMGVSAVFLRINNVLQDILNTFEYELIFQTTESHDFDTIESLIMDNVENVEEIYPGSGAIVQLEGYVSEQNESNQILVQGIVTDSDVALQGGELTEGSGWSNNPDRDGMVLTNEITNQLGKSLGDDVTIRVGGNERTLEIIGIANYPFPIGVMNWQDLARLTGFTLGAPTPNQYFTNVALAGYEGSQPDNQIAAWGINQQAASFMTIVEGEPVGPETGGLMLTQAAADTGGYAVGDEVTIAAGDCIAGTNTTASEDAGSEGAATTSGSSTAAQGCRMAMQVIGIFRPPTQVTSAADVPSDVAAFFWQDLAQLEGRSLEGKPVPNAFFVRSTNEDPDARAVDDLIESINDTLVDNGITASYTNMEQIADMASDAILSIGIVLNLASAIMAAVGAIGLITTLSIAVFERQKEIGVMRSVGAKSPTIITQFLVEGLLVGVIAFIIAAPLSVLLAWGLTEILPMGDFIEFAYPPIMLLAGFVGVMVIATISSVWPSVSAARKTVSDILRYQ